MAKTIEFRTKVNYPTTPEGIKEYNNSQSQAILRVLKNYFKLPPEQLDELMRRYEAKTE